MARAKVAVVHPRVGWGGSEAAVLWTLEALKHAYEVTLITAGGLFDLDRLNEYYGTRLRPGEFSLLQAPMPLGLSRTSRLAGLRGRLVVRLCRRVASRFDLMIGGYGPLETGARGIQLFADLSFDDELRRAFHSVPDGWKGHWYRPSRLRKVYLKLCDAIAPPDADLPTGRS